MTQSHRSMTVTSIPCGKCSYLMHKTKLSSKYFCRRCWQYDDDYE